MSPAVSVDRTASTTRAMWEAAHISETSVDIQLRTRQYIPEDSELHVQSKRFSLADTPNFTHIGCSIAGAILE
jgi:uncharacterized lipoprotein YbaY